MASRIEEVAQFLVADPAQKVAVVSAMGSHPTSPTKVTDLLINMVTKAAAQDQGYMLDLAALQVGGGGCGGFGLGFVGGWV